MMWKVCGMRDPRNIRDVMALGPDYMGFIFYPPSPRCALGMSPELPSGVRGVGVFVNASVDEIAGICNRYGLEMAQLHGDESPDFCRAVSATGLRVWKAIGLSDAPDWNQIRRYEGCVDMFVFDTRSAARGGTGQKFNWNILSDYPLSTPWLLSGGIGPDDTLPSLPGMAGVDINSRFEDAPGVKNVELIKEFIGNEQNRLAFCPKEQ